MRELLLVATLSILGVTTTFAGNTITELEDDKIVYGEDNRTEYFRSEEKLQKLADSTVALIKSKDLSFMGSSVKIDTTTLSEAMMICPGERFAQQPAAAFCSGFLIGPKHIATAGHCIRSLLDCINTRFVFGYRVEKHNRVVTKVKRKDVYKCDNVVSYDFDPLGADFAIIELDREVTDRSPLTMRKAQNTVKNTELVVIGHPSGLPVKIADGAKVRTVNHDFFVSNLDTFGGNSGSAVFNERTHNVEGILVRGDRDYVSNGVCYSVNQCPNYSCNGESSTNIRLVLDAYQRDVCRSKNDFINLTDRDTNCN